MKTRKFEYLSVQEFAEEIGVAPITVRRWDSLRMKGKPHALKRSGLNHRVYTTEQVIQYRKTQRADKD